MGRRTVSKRLRLSPFLFNQSPSHLTLPKANTRQTNPFIQCEYFMRQITTFPKNLRQTSTILQANLNG